MLLNTRKDLKITRICNKLPPRCSDCLTDVFSHQCLFCFCSCPCPCPFLHSCCYPSLLLHSLVDLTTFLDTTINANMQLHINCHPPLKYREYTGEGHPIKGEIMTSPLSPTLPHPLKIPSVPVVIDKRHCDFPN